MRPGGPAGLPYLGDDLPCLHLLPLPHQKLAAVGVEGHIPAAMVDSQVLSIAGTAGIPNEQHRPALHGADLCASGG